MPVLKDPIIYGPAVPRTGDTRGETYESVGEAYRAHEKRARTMRVRLRWHHIKNRSSVGLPIHNHRLEVILDDRPVFCYEPQPQLSREVAVLIAKLIDQPLPIFEENLWDGANTVEFDWQD